MEVYLVDGTYELFRAYFGAPQAMVDGQEVGAVRALVRSLAAWLRTGTVRHAGVAFDHVIESFRNQLFAGYKTGAGMAEDLYAQFPLAEAATAALGFVVWPMVEFEADDALATMAAHAAADARVARVAIASPDKDLAQCVQGDRIVMFDRHKQVRLAAPDVIAKFGVPPHAIPDYLALVGDTADGIPGLPGWGAKSSATVLAAFERLEAIPDDSAAWPAVRSRATLAATLASHRAEAYLYRQLATLRTDCPCHTSVDEMTWQGPTTELPEICARLGIKEASLGLPAALVQPREFPLDGARQ